MENMNSTNREELVKPASEEKGEEKENTDYKVYITTVIMICIVIVILFVKLLITHLEDVQMEGSTFKPLEQETNSNFK